MELDRICGRPSALAAMAVSLTVLAPALAGQSTPVGEGASARAGFGAAVAALDGEVFVGEANTQRTPGRVYVFRMIQEGDGWEEAVRITASDAENGDGFGTSLAADGQHLVVGGRGSVYVFQRAEDGSWGETARLTDPSGPGQTGFGRSVSMSGQHLLVGAPMSTRQSGAVYAFRLVEGTWTPAGALSVEGLRAASRFGTAVAVADDRAIVGAPMVNTAQGEAYAYRFDAQTGAWSHEGSLPAPELERNARFGSAVDLVAGFAVVSSPRFNGGRGAVFAYASQDATSPWSLTGSLRAFDETPGSGFGSALALGDMTLWVGAPGVRRRTGVLYSFTWDEGRDAWTSARKTAHSEHEGGDLFGSSVAASGAVAVAGAAAADFGEGSAVILDPDPMGLDLTPVIGEMESLDPVTGDEVKCSAGSASVFDCQDVDLVSFTPVRELGGQRGVEVNDIWGWTDPETGKEWVIVGRTEGTSFVDISDPSHPRFVGDLPKTAGASSSVWRDIKVYQDHAFIVSDGSGPHGMQVFDLTRLRAIEPGQDPVIFDADAHYDRIASAHNIVVNTATGFAYSVGSSSGGETCGGGLHMIDIRSPKNPTFAGCFSDPQTGRASTGYTHDAQCVVYDGPDSEHSGKEICFGANETALSVADVSDKTNPIALASASYPNVGYSHQGWLTDDHRYFLLNDELDEVQGNVEFTRTLIWDVTDLDDPQMLKEHFGTQKSSDHNLYIVGDVMYQSNYVSGLRVLDISDVENPVEVGFFDTVPWGENNPGFDGSWSNYPFFESGVIAVTSGQEGLFLVRKRPTGVPVS